MSNITKPNTTIPNVIPADVATLYQADVGSAVPALNVLNILGGTGTQTTASGNTININVINDGFPWTDELVTFNAVAQNGYFCEGVLTVNLPAAPTQGNTIIIYVDSASVVTIQANTGQTIQIGNAQSTTAGTAVSTAEGSTVTLVYRTSDSEWHSISDLGSWTLF